MGASVRPRRPGADPLADLEQALGIGDARASSASAPTGGAAGGAAGGSGFDALEQELGVTPPSRRRDPLEGQDVAAPRASSASAAAAAPEAPGVLARAVAALAEMGRHPLRTVGQMVSAPIAQFAETFSAPVEGEAVTAARELRGKAGPTPASARVPAGQVISRENTPGALTPAQFHRAAFGTAANAAFAPLAELVGAPLAAAAVGAAQSPDDPAVGALVGATLAGAGTLAGRAGAAVRNAGDVSGGVVEAGARGVAEQLAEDAPRFPNAGRRLAADVTREQARTEATTTAAEQAAEAHRIETVRAFLASREPTPSYPEGYRTAAPDIRRRAPADGGDIVADLAAGRAAADATRLAETRSDAAPDIAASETIGPQTGSVRTGSPDAAVARDPLAALEQALGIAADVADPDAPRAVSWPPLPSGRGPRPLVSARGADLGALEARPGILARAGRELDSAPEPPTPTEADRAALGGAYAAGARASAPAGAPGEAIRVRGEFRALPTKALADRLVDEQIRLETESNDPSHAPWVRQRDDGSVVSGGSFRGGRLRRSAGFTARRITEIEHELRRRGVSDDDIIAARSRAGELAAERGAEAPAFAPRGFADLEREFGIGDDATDFAFGANVRVDPPPPAPHAGDAWFAMMDAARATPARTSEPAAAADVPNTVPARSAARETLPPAERAAVNWRTWLAPDAPGARSVLARVEQEAAAIAPQLRAAKGYQSLPEQIVARDRFARELVADPLTIDREKLGRLTGPQVVALKSVVAEHTAVLEAASRALASGTLSEAEAAHASAVVDAATRATHEGLSLIVRESAQMGRDLGALRQLAKQTVDPDVMLVQAQRLAGDRPIPDTVMLEIRRLAHQAAEACGA